MFSYEPNLTPRNKNQPFLCVPHADNDCIGPCRVQQRRRSRAQQKQQEIPGSTYPDHEVRPWRYLIIPPQETGGRVLGATNPLSPFPPLQGSLGRDPLPPSTGHTSSPGNYHLGPASVKTSLRPPNLDQKSRIWHKTTEWSISG
jgi:hypothetical protein